MLDRAQHLERWRALHHGYDPTGRPLVTGWLTVMYDAAAPLARRGVSPDLITFASGDLALAVWLVAIPGGRWPLLSALLLAGSAALDGLDGAVAVVSERESTRGARLDRLVDRVSDLCFVAALLVIGAPAALAIAAGVGLLGFEGLRSWWSRAGRAGLGVVTVGERPTRLVLCGLALAVAGLLPPRAADVAGTAAAAVAALCALSVVQLALALRRSS